MKLRRFTYLGIVGTIFLLGTVPANAQGEEKLDQVSVIFTKDAVSKPEVAIAQIPQLSDIQRPHTSAKELLAQEQKQNEVTGIRLNPTANGLEVILETPTSDKLQTIVKNEGNNFIAAIPLPIYEGSTPVETG
ncbi:hypothetical protein [Nostoc sphaeroides]|uniref:TonB-dependent siderophore receptor n=1 Tax=Nostoc sphaeroides CCNUC1 TaxID=2653204 RepID=A0A5P8WEQ3_9NOSO|nr:hypothetical protein [Nostoc sphaeroides]QFS51248.1 TonB-dependent siderophore receptor [Nostoc sphaeroides CCNUC1]